MGWSHSSSPLCGPQGGSGGGIGWFGPDMRCRLCGYSSSRRARGEAHTDGNHRGAPAYSSYGANSTPITESMKSTKWFESTPYMPA